MWQSSVAHACNPSYSGGRDQEDHSSKPAWANRLQDAILKKPITKEKIKRAGGVVQGIGPEFKPQYHPSPPQKRGLIKYMLTGGGFQKLMPDQPFWSSPNSECLSFPLLMPESLAYNLTTLINRL
jgi:hypothetical protein